MRIALLGTRGIPANYGGFETFAEELAPRLAARGHQVTVYCRQPYPQSHYRGVRLQYLGTVRHKYFDTVVHTCVSTLHLLAQITREPCFDQLRTKEQLGYIVFSGTWSLTGVLSFKITIQSERTPIYLESRVDAFLEQLRGHITDMSPETFDRERQSLIDKKMDKLKNLGQETNRFWAHIHDGYNDFLRREFNCPVLSCQSTQ